MSPISDPLFIQIVQKFQNYTNSNYFNYQKLKLFELCKNEIHFIITNAFENLYF